MFVTSKAYSSRVPFGTVEVEFLLRAPFGPTVGRSDLNRSYYVKQCPDRSYFDRSFTPIIQRLNIWNIISWLFRFKRAVKTDPIRIYINDLLVILFRAQGPDHPILAPNGADTGNSTSRVHHYAIQITRKILLYPKRSLSKVYLHKHYIDTYLGWMEQYKAKLVGRGHPSSSEPRMWWGDLMCNIEQVRDQPNVHQ